MVTFGEMQKNAQMRETTQDAAREEAIAFQHKMEQEHIKFEPQLATTLQQQSSQFQANVMQQNQVFQAELKKHYEKKDR